MARDFIPGRHEPEIPSNTFAYFFREACRRIWIAKRTSFVAVAMIAISLLILGLFLLCMSYLCPAYHLGAMDEAQPGYQTVLSQLVAAVAGRGTQPG